MQGPQGEGINSHLYRWKVIFSAAGAGTVLGYIFVYTSIDDEEPIATGTTAQMAQTLFEQLARNGYTTQNSPANINAFPVESKIYPYGITVEVSTNKFLVCYVDLYNGANTSGLTNPGNFSSCSWEKLF